MTEVNLGEPDPSYFQIPEGYRVEVNRVPARPQVEPQPQIKISERGQKPISLSLRAGL